jgi:succinate dehydrogenase / fumarate reductase cytochrome b subunit
MAYRQTTEPVGRWSRILLLYRRHAGSWAWIFHRISGIALTAYLFIHIWALTSITKGRVEFTAEMKMFQKPVFMVLEFLLFLPVIYHALNGFRIVLVDLGRGARNHKALLRTVYAVAGLATVVMAFLMFKHWIVQP